MMHAVTLHLPLAYRRRGPGLPGVAYFLGEGQFAEDYVPVGDDDPFVADLKASRDHPQLERRTDLIGQEFALVWLSQVELDRGPGLPPADVRRPGQHAAEDEGFNAWDDTSQYGDARPMEWVYLAERQGDPNQGLAPIDRASDESRYRPVWGWGEDSAEWQSRPAWHCDDHLGGTTFAGANGLPNGLTAYYLELATPTKLSDYGNGETHVIDLESAAFDIC
ncbi:MAG: hypothetical protein LBO20_06230 [Bifidobacteriaceae bacterium]|jgi:hypothetical protein|nr:hypothetical protein [Bifidobacteriaceae bacterium]